MTVSIGKRDVVCDGDLSAGSHQTMSLVKRPSYELSIVIPHAPQTPVGQDQFRLHIRLKAQRQHGTFILDLGTLECFHQDLLCMLEYVQTERQKPVASKLACL
jgi:hypothetical protein